MMIVLGPVLGPGTLVLLGPVLPAPAGFRRGPVPGSSPGATALALPTAPDTSFLRYVGSNQS